VQKVRDDAYKIGLWGDINISATFNVGGLTPYIDDEDKGIEDLRANPLQGERLMRSKLQNPTS